MVDASAPRRRQRAVASWGLCGGLALGGLLGWPSAALAHIRLIEPAPRHEQQKRGPCGAGSEDGRGEVVSTFRPGQTITVRWQETVAHPGYFRIAFDEEGQDAFADPAEAGQSGDPAVVLVDLIADKEGTQTYEQAVTLPDVACERCTLQLVQVMTDKGPYGDGNDLYYQCADLVLSEDAPASSPESDEASSGCRTGSAGPLALVMLLGWRRRSRAG
ncbi:SCE4755 family polysaccharide monooxygenase-like protein [Nannocystis bainbridge]|uniref:Lytic polysaccharide monooxygenase n=1 Tax=Nannocystis bainbridge TaxID=2995303 RepID=A0ABT5E1N6_9BACT|nr:SCE4755 family polysaccharide monooxygenase-like protein [Nannocystis bainbridge]MDC0719749.1 lytic polysaccharide monooxygenase [Nannocystis bainbridge]